VYETQTKITIRKKKKLNSRVNLQPQAVKHGDGINKTKDQVKEASKH
jgi:hypothetical protein